MKRRVNPVCGSIASATLILIIFTVVGCGASNPTTPQSVPKNPVTALNEPTESHATKPTDASIEAKDVTALTSAESLPDAIPKSTAEKPKRESIYDTVTPGQELIAAAVRRAKRDHKHVLIEWRGNWCGWCYRLHDVFLKNPDVRPIVFEEFELVLVDSTENRDLLLEYRLSLSTRRDCSLPDDATRDSANVV